MSAIRNSPPHIEFIGNRGALPFRAEPGQYEEGTMTAQQEMDIDAQIEDLEYVRDINEHAQVPVRDLDGTMRKEVTPESLDAAAKAFIAGGSQELPKRAASESGAEFEETRRRRIRAGKAVLDSMGSLKKVNLPTELAAYHVATLARRKITSTREGASRLHDSDISRRYDDRANDARRAQKETQDA